MLPTDWEQVLGPQGVIGTVAVEASPWVEDTQWLLDLPDRHAPVATRQGIVADILGLVREYVAGRGADAGKAFGAGAAADAYRWLEK